MKSQQYEMNDIWINYSAREANVRITQAKKDGNKVK